METAISLSLSLPTSWVELTTAQQLYVYFLLSEGYSAAEIRSFCLLRWSGIEVLAAQGKQNYLVKHGKERGILSASQVAAAATELSFLDQLPTVPMRPENIDGHEALPADLMGVPFEKYLCLDNLYQGYLKTQDESIISQMAAILYDAEDIRLTVRLMDGRITLLETTMYPVYGHIRLYDLGELYEVATRTTIDYRFRCSLLSARQVQDVSLSPQLPLST